MSETHPKIEVITVENPLRDAARLAADFITQVDRTSGAARLALSGELADAFLLLLRLRLSGHTWDASPANVWPRLKMTWIDERCVPMDDPRSRRGAVLRSGVLDAQYRVGYELPLYCDGETPAEASARFDKQFAEHFGGALDVAVVDLATLLAQSTSESPAGQVVHESLENDATTNLSLSAQLVADAALLIVLARGRTAESALTLLRARSLSVRRRGPGVIYVVSDTPTHATTDEAQVSPSR
jgi:6-phosphogluconolactonase